MKVREKRIIRELKVEFTRGFLEDLGNETFFKVFIAALPEPYDYGNWTQRDLEDLRDAINAFLSKRKQEVEP